MAASIGRRDLLMLIIGLAADNGLDDAIGGITRLQKYLYLLQREAGVIPSGEGFEFEAYKVGPYSSKLYDDLEFLENLGLLESEVTADVSELEVPEIEALDFDQLLGEGPPGDAAAESPEAFEERRFRLTGKGAARVRELLSRPETQPFTDGIRKIKSSYGTHSLSDLLYHIYTKYPEMATASEIRDKVLTRRRQN